MDATLPGFEKGTTGLKAIPGGLTLEKPDRRGKGIPAVEKSPTIHRTCKRHSGPEPKYLTDGRRGRHHGMDSFSWLERTANARLSHEQGAPETNQNTTTDQTDKTPTKPPPTKHPHKNATPQTHPTEIKDPKPRQPPRTPPPPNTPPVKSLLAEEGLIRTAERGCMGKKNSWHAVFFFCVWKV